MSIAPASKRIVHINITKALEVVPELNASAATVRLRNIASSEIANIGTTLQTHGSTRPKSYLRTSRTSCTVHITDNPSQNSVRSVRMRTTLVEAIAAATSAGRTTSVTEDSEPGWESLYQSRQEMPTRLPITTFRSSRPSASRCHTERDSRGIQHMSFTTLAAIQNDSPVTSAHRAMSGITADALSRV